MSDESLNLGDLKSPRHSIYSATISEKFSEIRDPSSSVTPRMPHTIICHCDEESDEELSQLVESCCSTPFNQDEHLQVHHSDVSFKIHLKLREGCKAPLFRRALDHKLVSSKLEELSSNNTH